MSQKTKIEVCPICGKNTLQTTINTETKEKTCNCTECKFEHKIEKLKEGELYQENLAALTFFGNSYEHLTAMPEIKTLEDAEYKVREIEQINGVHVIKIVVLDHKMNQPMVVSGVMPAI